MVSISVNSIYQIFRELFPGAVPILLTSLAYAGQAVAEDNFSRTSFSIRNPFLVSFEQEWEATESSLSNHRIANIEDL